MSFYKKTIADVPLDGQRVLVRVDYNVPLKNGQITDDYRIVQSIPTIKALLDRGCQVILCSHLGRPKGQVNPEFSLEPIAQRLGELLGRTVGFVPECKGDKVVQAVRHLSTPGILLLENVRFHPEEEANDQAFAQKIASDTGAAYFVQDGFGVVHRAHATTEAITHFLPSVSGLLLENEVTKINTVMENPKRPMVAILGGAKISDKIQVIERFIDMADNLVIAGAMANTFLKYKGYEIGKSVHEDGQEAILERIYAKALSKCEGKCSVDEFIFLPTDVAVTTNIENNDHRRMIVQVGDVTPDEYIADIGPQTIARMLQIIQGAGTVVWNGTLGLAEYPTFAEGSARLAEALAKSKDETFSLIGGGDTADFVRHWAEGNTDDFGHVSTGGGASLDLFSGKKLPGVEALMNRSLSFV